jgi:protein-S-isoprenylcysteine O-methyltransferase Ste14
MTNDNTLAQKSKRRMSSYLLMALSGIIGGGSLVLFGIFLYGGLPHIMQSGFSETARLGIDAGLSLLFFLQHSLMVRNGFRDTLKGFIPPEYLGAVYSIFSGVFLGVLVLFWQKATSIQLEIDGVLFWVFRGLFFFSIIGFYITGRSLRPFDPLGIRDIVTQLKDKTAKASVFTIRGPYGWVRHPLYFLCLLMIWTPVSLTTDRLVFNIIWTVWIIIGTILEERDLAEVFGEEYRHYQRTVPMLIPYTLLFGKK